MIERWTNRLVFVAAAAVGRVETGGKDARGRERGEKGHKETQGGAQECGGGGNRRVVELWRADAVGGEGCRI